MPRGLTNRVTQPHKDEPEEVDGWNGRIPLSARRLVNRKDV
jgi:hypothetical protein